MRKETVTGISGRLACPLACPIDGLALQKVSNHLRCSSGHSFDIARQGYVNLLPVQHKRSSHPGDSKEMIASRSAFLDGAFYEPLAELLSNELAKLISEDKHDDELCILDAGCGEGYFLDNIHQAIEVITSKKNVSFVGLDISKPAIQAASKRNESIEWVVASNRSIPVVASSVDIILCLFGFPVFPSFRKVLKPGGTIFQVGPGPSHLIELRKLIYPSIDNPAKVSDPIDTTQFKLEKQQSLTYSMRLNSNAQVMQLLGMTPHLFRSGPEAKKRVQNLSELELTADFRVSCLSVRQ